MRSAWAWLALLALPVYFATFSNGAALARSVDVIADADTGAYVRLLSEWSIERRYGNAWASPGRSIGDQSQEHKIKHVLVPLACGPVSRWLATLGLSPLRAAMLPFAVLGAVNLLLIGIILSGLQVRQAVIVPLVALTAVAPYQWIYASVPESWTLSGTMVLLTIVAVIRGAPRAAVGVLVGVAMLNNVILVALSAFAALYQLRQRSGILIAVRTAAATAIVAVSVWLLALSVLGQYDHDLRPDRVARFLLFFPSLLEGTSLAPWDPRLLRVSLEQWLLTAFVSSQHNVRLAGWGLGETWGQSLVGQVAIVTVASLWLASGWAWYRGAKDPHVVETPGALPALLGLGFLMWGALHLLGPISMFLYSPALSPLVILAAGVALNRAPRRFDRYLWLAPALVLPAAVSQIVFLESYLR